MVNFDHRHNRSLEQGDGNTQHIRIFLFYVHVTTTLVANLYEDGTQMDVFYLMIYRHMTNIIYVKINGRLLGLFH